MERETETPEETPSPKDERDPTDTTPRGNPPTDDEAVAKGEEILRRVKPY